MSNGILEKPPAAQFRRAYDRNNLHPSDAEARGHDDISEGIDWDEILETTEDDYLAGRCAFSTAGYPDDATAMKALERWIESIAKRMTSHETPAASGSIAAGR